jgi:DegV family protein with EDD domain
MNKMIDFIFRQKKNPNYEALVKDGVYDVLRVSLIVTPLFIAAITSTFLKSFFWTESNIKFALAQNYQFYYACVIVCEVLYGILLLYIRKNYDERYRLLPRINVFMMVMLLWYAINVCRLDYTSYDYRVNPTLFMVVSMCVPFTLYLDVRLYLLITVISDCIFARLYFIEGPYAAYNKSSFEYFGFFIGTQLLLGVIVYYYKYNAKQNILEQEAQKEEIRKLSQAQNRFFSNMSHEIRTPINTIIGLNEMILRQNASPEINEDAENIQAASKMLLHLINDILDMSKFETGQMELTLAPYRIGDMLSDIVGMLWIRAKEKNLAFSVDVAPDLPSELLGDDMRIKQILINVLNNAIKYTSEGSVRLQIQCERNDSGVALVSYAISDTGMGIKTESIPYLFTAFKRVDMDKNKYIEGTGLGLSIVKQFVDLMGGKITVNSVYTKGTTFIIEIPQKIIVDEPVGEFDVLSRKRASEEHIYVQSFEAPDAKVLVVDDTSANLMVVSKLLRDTRINLELVSSGKEALDKTLENFYHVILMDHKMPGMDGIECMHAIRAQVGGQCQDSKIIALTANAGSDTKEMYFREGFDGYLMKPVTGEELENTVYHALPKNIVTVTGTAQELAEESTAWVREHKKKKRIKVTTDSVADIPAEFLEQYDIAMIPHMVKTSHGLFKDGLEIETSGLISYMEGSDESVETLAPSVEEYSNFFSKQLDEANNVIHISISSRILNSGYTAAKKAAADFGNVTVIDSGHLSSSQGLMAVVAARFADEGKDVESISVGLETLKKRVHTSFIVESLDYLVRQKYVSEQGGYLADAFMAHPVLVLKKGKMVLSRFYFGSRERAWKKYIAAIFRVSGSIDHRFMFITYAGMTTRDLERVRELVEEKMKFDKIFIQKASPAIAASCGPGTFGLLFFTE